MAPRQVLDGIQGCSGRASFDGEELLPQVLEGLETGQLPQQLQRKRSELCCCASLEAACQALDVGRIADAQRHLAAAERCLGVSSEVTGKREASVLLSRACFLFAITQAFLQQGCKVVSGLSGKVTMGMQGCHRNQEPMLLLKQALDAQMLLTLKLLQEPWACGQCIRQMHVRSWSCAQHSCQIAAAGAARAGETAPWSPLSQLLHDTCNGMDRGMILVALQGVHEQLITDGVSCSGDEAEWLDARWPREMPDQAGAGTGSSKASHANGSSMRAKELEGLSGDSDVLLVPKLETADGEESTHSLVLGHLVLIVTSNCTVNACSSIKVQRCDTQLAKNMQMRLHCMNACTASLGATWAYSVGRLCNWLWRTHREGG